MLTGLRLALSGVAAGRAVHSSSVPQVGKECVSDTNADVSSGEDGVSNEKEEPPPLLTIEGLISDVGNQYEYGIRKVVTGSLKGDINSKGAYGKDFLFCVCDQYSFQNESERVVIAEVLLTKYQWNVHTDAHFGETPLTRAASSNQMKLLEVLLNHHADVNAKTGGGWTALHCACLHKNNKAVKFLLKNGANINPKNRGGWTAKQLALRYNNHSTVQIIEEFEAKLKDVEALANVTGMKSNKIPELIVTKTRPKELGLLMVDKSVVMKVFSFLKPEVKK